MTATLVETPEPYFDCYSLRTLSAEVCTNLSDDAVVKEMNTSHPMLGVWRIATSKEFPGGKPNPHDCDSRHGGFAIITGRRHILMVCV